MLIAAVAGVLVMVGNLFLEKLKINDTVGAWSVHGLCGIWGGFATGIFGAYSLGKQVLASLVIAAWASVRCSSFSWF